MTNPPISNSSTAAGDDEKKSRTLNLTPIPGEMLKPAELIDIDGATGLTLAARRMYNQLIAHAFGPDMGKEGQEWSIPLSELRGSHKGNERIEESILSLMKTIITVRLPDGGTRRAALLGGNDMGDVSRPHGALTYSFDRRLVPLLRDSSVFGKLELEVLHAFSTKYALALYEAVARRVRLRHKFTEILELAVFREILGVPPGKLEPFGNLKVCAIVPAVAEVNALTAYGCVVTPKKTGRKVTHVTLGWWLKDVDGLKDAYAELQRPRVGRRARINGTAEMPAEDPGDDQVLE